MIKIQDLARDLGVTDRTIQKHLHRLTPELEGHFERRGRNGTWLDDVAVEAIRSRMVMPPAPVISDGQLAAENEKLKNALLEIQQKYIGLQEKLINYAALEAEASNSKQLLQQAADRQDQLENDLADAQSRVLQLEQQLENLKNRSFWDRLFNR